MLNIFMEAGLDYDVRMLKLNLLNLFVNAMRQAGCICKKIMKDDLICHSMSLSISIISIT